jgi:hypothetical protein
LGAIFYIIQSKLNERVAIIIIILLLGKAFEARIGNKHTKDFLGSLIKKYHKLSARKC